MLSERMLGALNAQINAELSSAYQYLAMAAYFESINLEGSARWMKRQSREEVEHAMRIFEFIHDRDGRVSLAAVAQPQAEFGSPLTVCPGCAISPASGGGISSRAAPFPKTGKGRGVWVELSY